MIIDYYMIIDDIIHYYDYHSFRMKKCYVISNIKMFDDNICMAQWITIALNAT